jgi:hypothetical protein
VFVCMWSNLNQTLYTYDYIYIYIYINGCMCVYGIQRRFKAYYYIWASTVSVYHRRADLRYSDAPEA